MVRSHGAERSERPTRRTEFPHGGLRCVLYCADRALLFPLRWVDSDKTSRVPVSPLGPTPRLSVPALIHQMATRILIVDDYLMARKTVRSLLVWHSLEVCGEAENGKQAIEKVKRLKPDLVLLDINMPEMNGVQAAYEIRR